MSKRYQPYFNEITISGKVVYGKDINDPMDLIKTFKRKNDNQEGKSVSFGLLVKPPSQTPDNDKSYIVNVKGWDALAERVTRLIEGESFGKNFHIAVKGELMEEKWNNKDGQEIKQMVIQATTIKTLADPYEETDSKPATKSSAAGKGTTKKPSENSEAPW